MRYGSVKHIALYYKAIPGMLRLLRQERAELEGNYYGLRGLACDGMPRGSSPGKPTEESGLRALENGVKLRSVQYTADFRLTYADGTVEIVEIKSKFVRRMQRDYPVRRRVFLELIARPAGWKFTEIITAEDKEEIKRWRELAEEVSSCGKNG